MSVWRKSNPAPIPEGRLKLVTVEHEGKPVVVWELQCPECGCWGIIDEDQLYGRVSCDHTDEIIGCTFHETRNWFETAERAA